MDYNYYVHHLELKDKTDDEIKAYVKNLDKEEAWELFIYYVRQYK